MMPYNDNNKPISTFRFGERKLFHPPSMSSSSTIFRPTESFYLEMFKVDFSTAIDDADLNTRSRPNDLLIAASFLLHKSVNISVKEAYEDLLKPGVTIILALLPIEDAKRQLRENWNFDCLENYCRIRGLNTSAMKAFRSEVEERRFKLKK